jgi:hypothetical protein
MSAAVPILSTVKVTALTKDQALAHWPVVGPMLEKAIPHACGRITLEDVRQAVEDEMAMVIIVWDPQKSAVYMAFSAESEVYKTGVRCMNLNLAGGDSVELWSHLWPELKRMAKTMGFNQIELTGRPGWGRVLGLRETSRTFIEDL